MIHPIQMFGLMLFAHALADYPLQSDFLAKGKNTKHPINGYNPWVILFMHSIIHGGFVGIITGSVIYGFAETLVHMLIDYLKCQEETTFLFDQFLHVMCKAQYVIMFYYFGWVPRL